jgi:molybdopterin-synthase adenylyltransferase
VAICQSFLGPDSEQILADARVTIVGLDGGGSHIAQQLAHVGVGHFRLIDPQEIEDSNLNRLIGGTKQDVGAKAPKVEIAERLIRGIRPWAEVRTAKREWQVANDLLKNSMSCSGALMATGSACTWKEPPAASACLISTSAWT